MRGVAIMNNSKPFFSPLIYYSELNFSTELRNLRELTFGCKDNIKNG